MGGGIFKNDILDAFEIFLTEKEKKNKKLIRNLENDIIKSYFKYGSIPKEYFVFGFRNYNSKKRSEFLTNQHKDKVIIKNVRTIDREKFTNKIIFHENFKEYFKRDVCKIEVKKDQIEFIDFCQRHEKFIVKPIDGQCGRGIEVMKSGRTNEDVLFIFNNLLDKGTWIVEELIIQDKRMAKWNCTSVNTIRLPTFLKDNVFYILKPFIRVGRNNSIVDNSNSGGLFSVIDEETGVLLLDGYNSMGKLFKKHPDSKVVFKNQHIPKWNQLLKLAEEIHRTIPHHRYVAWDFALANNGWVLIEGNSMGQFMSEFADKEGIKKEFDSLFD